MCSQGSELCLFIQLCFYLSIHLLSFLTKIIVKLNSNKRWFRKLLPQTPWNFRGLAGIENPFMTHWDEYGHFITHFTCGRWFIKTPGEVSSVNHLQSLQPMKEHLEAIRFPVFLLCVCGRVFTRGMFSKLTAHRHFKPLEPVRHSDRLTQKNYFSSHIHQLKEWEKIIWYISRERINTNMV